MDSTTDYSHLPVVSAGIALLGIALIVLWACYRWKRLKQELFPEKGVGERLKEKPKPASSDFRAWVRQLPNLVGHPDQFAEGFAGWAENFDGDFDQALASSVELCRASIRKVAEASLDANEVRSALIRRNGVYVYLVAVPRRLDHPQLIRRLPAFRSGWRSHLEAFRDALMRQPDSMVVTAYLAFINPDGRNGALYFSWADRGQCYVPSELKPTSDAPLDREVSLR